MELALVITVGLIFALLGAACVALVLLGLPGAWMMLGLAVLIEVADPLYLHTGSDQTFGWWLLGACLALATLGEILEFVAGALGAKKAGSSRRGMWGAIIGGIVGGILGVAIPVPVVGSLIGAVIGTFAGAIFGELSGDANATVRSSLKPASGATIGRILGTLAKLPIAMAIWASLTIAALWP